MTTAYVDASALVKLVLNEAGSVAMNHFVALFDEIVTSRVGVIETRRASARKSGPTGLIDMVLESVGAIELDPAISATAAILEPVELRTLDAIHLATALTLYQLDAFVTYDDRLADAARSLGLPVASPA